MHSDIPNPGGTPGPSTHEAEPEPRLDFELLELQYGPGGVLLDSDDIDALIAERQDHPPASEVAPDEPSAPSKPAARKAA
jgi:hypothetical protein